MILNIQADPHVAGAVEAMLRLVSVDCRTTGIAEVGAWTGYDAIVVGADYFEGGPLAALDAVQRDRLLVDKPIIYVAEDYDLERRSNALRHGATAILNWPCSTPELLGCIEQVLRAGGQTHYAHLSRFAAKTSVVPIQ